MSAILDGLVHALLGPALFRNRRDLPIKVPDNLGRKGKRLVRVWSPGRATYDICWYTRGTLAKHSSPILCCTNPKTCRRNQIVCHTNTIVSDNLLYKQEDMPYTGPKHRGMLEAFQKLACTDGEKMPHKPNKYDLQAGFAQRAARPKYAGQTPMCTAYVRENMPHNTPARDL